MAHQQTYGAFLADEAGPPHGADALPPPSRTTTVLRWAAVCVAVMSAVVVSGLAATHSRANTVQAAQLADGSSAPQPNTGSSAATPPSHASSGNSTNDRDDAVSFPGGKSGGNHTKRKHTHSHTHTSTPTMSPTISPTDSSAKRSKDPAELRIALYDSLTAVADDHAVIFAHQNSNREGQYFWDDAGLDMHSDIFNLTGQFPGMYGYDFQNLVDGKKLTNHVLKAAVQHSVINFFWEAKNPLTGGGARDLTGNPCAELLPGGAANANWTKWMDSIVRNLDEFKIGDEYVPLLVRLFHEHTEGWYWWGVDSCTAKDYKEAFRYTKTYLRDFSERDNMLIVYAPAKVSETAEEAFDIRYPGDKAVDIIGFDRYSKSTKFTANFLADCRVACSFAASKGKLCGAAEVGIADGVQKISSGAHSSYAENWFVDDLLNVVMSDANCSRLSYILTWTNERPQKYWVPLAGQPAAPGFLNFTYDNRTIFAGDLKWEVIRKANGYSFKDSELTNLTTSASHNSDLARSYGYHDKNTMGREPAEPYMLGSPLVNESSAVSATGPEHNAPLRSVELWD